MDYLTAIVLGAIGSLIAAEMYAGGTCVADRIIRQAALRLPEHERERFREEWRADNADVAGSMRKILHALGCFFGAAEVADALCRPSPSNAKTDVSDVEPEENETSASVDLATGEIDFRIKLRDAREIYVEIKKLRNYVAHSRTDRSLSRKDIEYLRILRKYKKYLDRD